MPKISNDEYQKFLEYKNNERNGHILTPNTLRCIVRSNGYDAWKIGQYFLEILPKLQERSKR